MASILSKLPEGAISSREEIKALIAKAKASGNAIPIWRVAYSIGHDRAIINPRYVDLGSKLTGGRWWFSEKDESGFIEKHIDTASVFSLHPNHKIFTNYWLAWAYAQRLNQRPA